MLARLCWSFTFLLLCYGIVLHIPSKTVRWSGLCACFLAAQLVLNYYMLRGPSKKARLSFSRTQGFCLLQSCIMMAFVICASVFPFPDFPAVLFSPALMTISILFHLPLWVLSLNACLYASAFLVLALFFKTESAFCYDL